MSKSYETYTKLDKSQYEGEYIGICDDIVVCHSKSFEEVFEKTKKYCGNKVPFVTLVPVADCMLL